MALMIMMWTSRLLKTLLSHGPFFMGTSANVRYQVRHSICYV